MPMLQTKRPVWDIAVRCFHWLLVAAVATSAVTGFLAPINTLDVHLIAGCVISGLVGFRLAWGFLGGSYARFSSFAFSPRVVLDYARATLQGRGRRYLGHNPLGALMVFALLAVLLLIVLSGVVVLGGELKQGPLAAFTTFASGRLGLSVHNALAYFLMAMVAVHLAGVGFESYRERENLTRAMIDGRKREEGGQTAPARRSHAILAAVLVVGGGGVVAAGVGVLAARPGLGVPPLALNEDYARECASCHMAFHPSLLTFAGGEAIMARLGDHFGADASLSGSLMASIGSYLKANSAEHWDTLPAVMFRRTASASDPRRITVTGFWQRRHRGISDAVFTAKPVYRRTNCAACHADAASGLFSPQGIGIPDQQ